MYSRIVLIFVSGSVLTACPGSNPPDRVSAAVPTGFVCSTSPSEAYGPGYIFRVDPTGAANLVADLRSEVTTFDYSAALATYETSLATSGQLKFALTGGTASGSASASTTSDSRISFTDGRFSLMDDAGEERLVSIIEARFEPRDDSRYYLVRDAIQATGIDIALSSRDEASLGGEAQIAGMFTANPGVQVSRDDNLTISGTFPNPLNVCARAIELAIGSGRSTGPSPVIDQPGQRTFVNPNYLAGILDTL